MINIEYGCINRIPAEGTLKFLWGIAQALSQEMSTTDRAIQWYLKFRLPALP